MTDKTDKGFVIIYDEAPQECQFCFEIKETRPYSKDEREICFDCMTATPEAEKEAERRFKKLLNEKTRTTQRSNSKHPTG
ncbi:hypothetical protein LCGC14_0477680 [marine sediment metagenome]|uniref:Uncharacterized protein n=1 Tax=marine sediment metagenome TaxID=412755 RepID=A0A0F9STC0_9ZZZZ